MTTLTGNYATVTGVLDYFSGFAPLVFRLILAPVMIIAGYSKLGMSGDWESWIQAVLADPNVVAWFGNPDWGLGLPMPGMLAFSGRLDRIPGRLAAANRTGDADCQRAVIGYHGGGGNYGALGKWLVCDNTDQS